MREDVVTYTCLWLLHVFFGLLYVNFVSIEFQFYTIDFLFCDYECNMGYFCDNSELLNYL